MLIWRHHGYGTIAFWLGHWAPNPHALGLKSVGSSKVDSTLNSFEVN